MAVRWWQAAVVVQVYPRSFAHGGSDSGPGRQEGVGDLDGIRQHLDHLSWLGVDAVWLSPFYRSPMADLGYDVSGHCEVDPLFGTLGDFDALVAEAHARGLRVIVDWVPNHTSDQHPWFVDARSSRTARHRDWYVWRDPGADGGPPNNWVRTWSDHEPAWTFDHASGQWYLHLFLPSQPDLNWANPEVVEAMHGVVRFWLDRGVDGLRVDVLHGLGKHPDLPDDPPELAGLSHSLLNHDPSTHRITRGLRAVLEEYEGDRMMVGEVFLLDTSLVAEYYGGGDGHGVHLAFNFPPLFERWDARRWRRRLEEVAVEIEPVGWPTWVLSNHDVPRHRTRYGGSEARARAAAVLLLTLRGTPFLYAGEELGLEDAVVPPDRVVDPGGRDGCRAPIPWDATPTHGWGTTGPWLPWPPDPERRNVATQRQDEGSILHLYRRLIAERRASAALTQGDQTLLDAPEGVLAWDRWDRWDRADVDGDRRRVVLNFTGRAVDVAELVEEVPSTEPAGSGRRARGPGRSGGGWVVVVSSDGRGEGRGVGPMLGPDQAVVLRPRS